MTIFCPSCHQEIDISEKHELYCSKCGTFISLETINTLISERIPGLEEKVIMSFSERDYSEVIEYSDTILKEYPDRPLIKAYNFAARIMRTRSEYISRAKKAREKLSGSTFKHMVGKLVFGIDDYDKDPMHRAYLDEMKGYVEEVSLNLGAVDEREKGNIPIILNAISRALLVIPDDAPYYTKTILIADDYLFSGLLSYLSDEALKNLLDTYGSAENRKLAFPNQLKLISQMEDEMKKRGLSVPETSRKKGLGIHFGR